jgi:hypothetical protein
MEFVATKMAQLKMVLHSMFTRYISILTAFPRMEFVATKMAQLKMILPSMFTRYISILTAFPRMEFVATKMAHSQNSKPKTQNSILNSQNSRLYLPLR